MGKRTAAFAVVAALAAWPTGASAAADRYASPSGTGSVCTQAQPCDIVSAVNSGTMGDNVTIEPGTYGPINTNLTDAGEAMDIHGEAGQPRPVIETTASYGFSLSGGSTLSDVEVDDTAAGAYGISASASPSTISDVIVHASGAGAYACYPDSTLTDSVCWASGPNGIGATVLTVASVTATLRNDTVVASGSGGYGVAVYGEGGATMTINLSNTIAHGAGADIWATTDIHFNTSEAIVNADHSNYSTVTEVPGAGTISVTPAGSGTNQKASPVFADAASGNFHELAGSPTIGAGVDSALNGSADLDGNPREIAGKTDIGAYEFLPPPTCTAANVSVKFEVGTPIKLQCAEATGAALTYAIAAAPAHGKLSAIGVTGAVTYTPAAGFSGHDSFTYRATSADGASAPATVSITVGKEPSPAISHAKVHEKTLTFTLNEAASVTLTFARHGHKKRTVELRGKAGKNSYKLKKLEAGKYTISIAASNAGGRAKKKTLRLKVKR